MIPIDKYPAILEEEPNLAGIREKYNFNRKDADVRDLLSFFDQYKAI